MNIVFFMQNTGFLYGAERVTLDLAAGLQADPDCDVHLCLIEETRIDVDTARIPTAAVDLGVESRSIPVSHTFSPRLVLGLRSHLKAQKADLLYAVGSKALFHGLPAARSTGIPCCSTVHGWLFRRDRKERFYAWLERMALKRCDRVFVLSRYYRDLLASQGCASERLVRIPTGVEAPAESRESKAGATRFVTIGYAGRMSEEKQPQIMLELAEASRSWSTEVRFICAGQGPLLDALRQEVSHRGLQDRLEFPGFVDAATWLSDVDILVNCSRIENLPMSILEAMGRGIPAAAFSVGGIPDLIEPHQTGILAPPGRTDLLCEGVQRMVEDSVVRTQFGAAAREKLKQEFSREQWIAAHLEQFRLT